MAIPKAIYMSLGFLTFVVMSVILMTIVGHQYANWTAIDLTDFYSVLAVAGGVASLTACLDILLRCRRVKPTG